MIYNNKMNSPKNMKVRKNVLKFIFNTLKTRMTTDITSDMTTDITSDGSLKKEKNSLIYDMSDRDIINMIKEYLPIRQKEKKEFGEAFTPKELIDEMLDKLPEEVWSDPNLKWLDPANGIGNFPMVVYSRLMESLKKIRGLKDKKKRHDHIIGNMLYMVELNPRNVEISKRIFGEEANIYCGDFLEEKWDCKFEVDKFDIVIGNPPFQEVDNKTGKSKGGGNNLYTKFIYKIDQYIVKNGYLLFINPPSYFSPGRSNNKDGVNLRKDIFDKYYYHYINLEECSKYFNVGSKFIYYLIQKNNYKNDNLEIVCKYNKYIYKTILNQKLLIRDYIPYLLTKESLKILDKVKYTEPKLKIFNSTVFDKRRDYVLKKNTKETDENYKKRAIKEGYIFPIQATGNQIVYSSKKCKNQNDKKVLMSRSGYLKPFYDDGILGVGGDCYACLVNNEEEGNILVKILNSKLYKFYIETNKWSGFHNIVVLQDLPNIINDFEINDQNIYKYFNISNEEIKLIEDIM